MDTVVIAVIAVVVIGLIFGATKIRQLSFLNLIVFVIATLIGLSLGALLGGLLGQLPAPYGSILPLAVALVITIISISVFLSKVELLLQALPFLRHLSHDRPVSNKVNKQTTTLVDTSVIIDGRISDIAKAGFVPGKLLVPRFVLAELQNIADSDDAMRRGRGRRGLEILNEMRQVDNLETDIIDDDMPDIKEVDAKLVHIAKKLGAQILTTDYNLNRVAQIEGVRVLNINELSNAIRPVVLPGEEMVVRIVQAGKERGQGVGYLADGTMIVVDNGDKMIGQEVTTEVTRVFQTVAGKMIFATPKNGVHATSLARKPRRNHNGHRSAGSQADPASQPPASKPHKLDSHSAIEDRLIGHNR